MESFRSLLEIRKNSLYDECTGCRVLWREGARYEDAKDGCMDISKEEKRKDNSCIYQSKKEVKVWKKDESRRRWE